LGLVLLGIVLMRTFLPAFLTPKITVPNLVLLSLAVLLVDFYIAPGAKRRWIEVFALAFASFAVLPAACGYIPLSEAIRMGVLGGGVFTVTAWLYSAMTERIRTGSLRKLAPVISAFGLYLAAQCFQGIV